MRIIGLVATTLLACTSTPAPETFRTVASELDGTLLSAWTASDGTTYMAGGVVGGGKGLLLRWDGQTVTPVATPDAHAFWWIHGVSDGEMWLAGEAGEVHRFDGTTVTAVDVGAPAASILFGVWGADDGDLWAVGGSFVAGGPRRIVRHLVRGSWTAVDSPADVDADITYFKVWGASASDVWLVGDRGVVVHSDGTALTRVYAPPAERYLTVNGCGARDVYVVGGGASGTAVHFDGDTWSPLPLMDAPPLGGVACADGGAYVGGFLGYAARLQGGTARVIALPAALQDLAIHGIAVGGPANGRRVIAVGGDLLASVSDPQRGFAVELAH